jgi:hypothetical protein
MINGLEWPIGWRPLVEGETADSFEAELRREVSTDHVLHGEPVSLIARRDDCDDYLFALEDARVAQVHLTWSQEQSAEWPAVQVFPDLTAWRNSVS